MPSRERSGRAAESAARRRAPIRFDERAEAASRAREAEAEMQEQRKQEEGFGAKLSAKLARKKKERAKEKADKSFTRQYGSAQAGTGEQAGPRAAVYKGEMGTQHRKAARMQEDASSSKRAGSSASSKRARKLPRFVTGIFAVAACLFATCVLLYGPAQQFYQEIRERDRLEAEYAAVTQRNDAIRSEVDSLSTPAGVEDRAREEFGWVKEGESVGSVTGINVVKESNFRANIVPGSVPAPETWYSSWLDPIFGVE